MTDYSPMAGRLVELLSKDELQQIRKDNPFRAERNNIIRKLYKRGVSQVAIAEVGGMSSTAVGRICTGSQSFERIDQAGEG